MQAGQSKLTVNQPSSEFVGSNPTAPILDIAMNYAREYMTIILRAAVMHAERKQARSAGSYFESHHIVPKSLGGSNSPENMVLLTAKEHYVCHRLLAYMYPPGTDGYRKMTYAWWRMATGKQRRFSPISATEYARLRARIASLASRHNAISQAGGRNSQYGSHWYSNIDTGASASFHIPPNDRWVPGRNLFKHTASRPSLWSIFTKRPVTVIHGKILRSRPEARQHAAGLAQAAARSLWDRYHSGSWTSLSAFCREGGVTASVAALTSRFKQFIPIYSRVCVGRQKFPPDPSMVHVYE